MVFQNRQEAGEILAQKLSEYKDKSCIILAVPKGGVPVASEVAKALHAPMDVLIVRKICAPFNSDFTLGAICETDDPLFKERNLSRSGLEPDDLNVSIKVEKTKIAALINMFRNGRTPPFLTEQIVILVDDGLASGATVLAAIKYLKKVLPLKIILAAPVAAARTARMLRRRVDEVIAVEEVEDVEELKSLHFWYKDFSKVSDDEVLNLLKANIDNIQRLKNISEKIKKNKKTYLNEDELS